MRRLLDWIDRLAAHPSALKVLAPLTVLGLGLAAFAVFGVLAQDDARERDRVASDVAACERTNRLRVQVVALGGADQDMVSSILDIVLPAGESPKIDEVRSDLQPALDRHQAVLDEIQPIDCASAVPGARTPTTEVPR